MRLTSLHPEWKHEEPGDPHRVLAFDCPCGCGNRIEVPLQPKRKDGWEIKEGSTFEDLTLHPSIRYTIEKEHWHGFVLKGEVTKV